MRSYLNICVAIKRVLKLKGKNGKYQRGTISNPIESSSDGMKRKEKERELKEKGEKHLCDGAKKTKEERK